MDLSPNVLSGLRAGASYYNIHYTIGFQVPVTLGIRPTNGLRG